MQQWDPTCSVEISTLQGIENLDDLNQDLYKIGFNLGAFLHWGQELDLAPQVRGHGTLYERFGEWRDAYANLSDNFASRTFANALSDR